MTTHDGAPVSRRRRASRLGPVGLASSGLALLLAALPVAAQESSPAPGSDDGPPASVAAGAAPALTWAPLVTLRPIVAPSVTSPAELADGYALGSPDAPVTVEVWEDFQCPFCQLFTLQVEPLIVDEFVRPGDVRLVFRNLAFLGDESHWAAVAGSLAAEQDLFWPYHDYLFANLQGENVGSYDLQRLLEIGEAVGLDMAAFQAGLRLEAARQRFAEIQDEARRDASALGINATPTVVVEGVPLRSPDFETVSEAIRVALGADAAADAIEESPPPAP